MPPKRSPTKKRVERKIFGEVRKGAHKKALEKLEEAELFRPDDGRVQRFRSASLGLDIRLGGGIPRKRMIEMAGEPYAGKTTFALENCGEWFQQFKEQNRVILYQDPEHTFDILRANEILMPYGLNLVADQEKPMAERRFILQQPYNAEEARKSAVTLVEAGGIGMYVLDSVAMYRGAAETEAVRKDKKLQAGFHAKVVSELIYAMTSIIAEHDTTWILVNQLRDNLDWTRHMQGPDSTGGRALKFGCTARMLIQKGMQNKASPPHLDSNIRIKKNKLTGWEGKFGLPRTLDAQVLKAEEMFMLGLAYDLIVQHKPKKNSPVKFAVPNTDQSTPCDKAKILEWIKETPAFRDLVLAAGIEEEKIKA